LSGHFPQLEQLTKILNTRCILKQYKLRKMRPQVEIDIRYLHSSATPIQLASESLSSSNLD